MNWFVFAVGFSCVCMGYWLAVMLGHRGKPPEGPAENADEAPADEAEPAISPLQAEQAREFIQELQRLTVDVNSDIDRHASQVTMISDELSSSGAESSDSTVVLAAAAKLIDANKQLKADLEFAKEEIRVQQQQLEWVSSEARTDALTGVANRRAFDEELNRRFAQWQRKGTPLSIALADVDYFKRFNDYHGHQVGDETLRGVAQVLAETVREMDIVARYGGEEFVVILPATTLEEGECAAERLREAVAEHRFDIGDAGLQVTVSVGVAQAVEGETAVDLVHRADDALYAAKDAGRDCTFCHDGQATLSSAALRRLIAERREAERLLAEQQAAEEEELAVS